MRAGEQVFVDTGAWIALALTRDPLHARARATYERVGFRQVGTFATVLF